MGMAQLGNRLYTGESSFDFVGRRKLWFLIAGALVLISAILLVKPGLTYGIEFEGARSSASPGPRTRTPPARRSRRSSRTPCRR